MNSRCVVGSGKRRVNAPDEIEGKILLVFAGKYPLLKELRARGLRLINFQKPEFCDPRSLPLCDYTVLGDLDDAETIAGLAGQFSRAGGVVGAYSQNEYGLHAAALTNEILGADCRFNSTNAVLNARDKLRFRKRIECADLESGSKISWRFCNDSEELRRFLAEVSWPEGVLLKPARGVGSMGVSRVREASEIRPANVPVEGVLAETFMAGVQYSVETFSYFGKHEVICVNREINSYGNPLNAFINMGHMLPIHLDADVDGVLHERVLDALDAVEVFHGPAHTEVIVRDGKVSIIEVNARPAGSPIPAMIQLVTGVNLYQHSLDWFLGRNMRAEPQKLTGKGAAVRHFGPPPGRLVAIRGLERVRLIGGVKEIVLKVAPGDRIHPLRSAFDRVGYLTAVAATAEDAYSICREAVDAVEFDVEPV